MTRPKCFINFDPTPYNTFMPSGPEHRSLGPSYRRRWTNSELNDVFPNNSTQESCRKTTKKSRYISLIDSNTCAVYRITRATNHINMKKIASYINIFSAQYFHQKPIIHQCGKICFKLPNHYRTKSSNEVFSSECIFFRRLCGPLLPFFNSGKATTRTKTSGEFCEHSQCGGYGYGWKE